MLRLITPLQKNNSHHKSCVTLRIFTRVRNRIFRNGASAIGFSQGYATLRGVRKTAKKTTLAINDLPQGLITHDSPKPMEQPGEVDDNIANYPTVVQQAKNNMQKFKHCVVLTRVGGFYELYFEHAEEYGPLLNLRVGVKKTSAGPVAMAGFPFVQLDRYLKVLVQDLGKYVAISEETANDPSQRVRSGGLLFDREVKRIVTPGTLIDENFLSPFEHNYLLAIHPGNLGLHAGSAAPEGPSVLSKTGLAWLDLSSGDFFVQSIESGNLTSALARISPREVVLDKTQKSANTLTLSRILSDSNHSVNYHDTSSKPLQMEDWGPMLENPVTSLMKNSFVNEEIASANLLLGYVKLQLPGLKIRLQTPIKQKADDFMVIDKHSLQGLEIVQTLRDGLFKGSLLQAVRRTSTESGARLLASRLKSPSMSLDIINERLNMVEELLQNTFLVDGLTSLLRRTFDALRLVQKFSFGRGDAEDLLSLSRTITITRAVGQLIEDFAEGRQCHLKSLLKDFQWTGPSKLADRIAQAIDQDGLMLRQRSDELHAAEPASMALDILQVEDVDEEIIEQQKRLNAKRKSTVSETGTENIDGNDDIWIMRRTASTMLSSLHASLDKCNEEKTKLATKLREQLGAIRLTLRYTPGLGHICHMKGKDARVDLSMLQDVRIVNTTKSTRSFYFREWTSLGICIENTKARIRGEEQHVLQSLREEVIENIVILRRNAGVLDELDVACSFARLAKECNLKRPVLNEGISHTIWGGRHLTVEAGLTESGRHFTRNDLQLVDQERIWLITGPNMAGKSTFLRQSALISILAQTGSFIPADYAVIGLVDRIFSRIGSADNLSRDQSTFMVEMLETAHILRHATQRSFVIMDEVGRGTTPEDGVAVGYAALHHLHYTNRCRALFATHFHALADMTINFDSLARYCTDVVEEEGGAFRYDHRMLKGVNRSSHALKVAKLAGMPQSALDVARDVLLTLHQHGDNHADSGSKSLARAQSRS